MALWNSWEPQDTPQADVLPISPAPAGEEHQPDSSEQDESDDDDEEEAGS